jgi:hypothetical protein
MGDPELRSDEFVILRTPGIYVKSIPFEGILTNKRILLIDRVTNLLPQREIPLVTLKDFEAGENAIRDQILSLTVLARSGETRQMILTFSRKAGGTRIKERDEWLRVLKENTSSSFEQVIRKVVPGYEQSSKKPERIPSPRIAVINSPMDKNLGGAIKITGKKEVERPGSMKTNTESSPPSSPPAPAKDHTGISPGFGMYCSRCGNRVPEGSGFCNRCGSRIAIPENVTPILSNSGISQSSVIKANEDKIEIPETKEGETPAALIDQSSDNISSLSLPTGPREREVPKEQIYAVPTEEYPGTGHDIFTGTQPISEKPGTVNIPSQVPESNSRGVIPPEPFGFKPGSGIYSNKKIFMGIIAIIIIIAIILGGFFLYPLLTNGSSTIPANGSTIINNSGTAGITATTSLADVTYSAPTNTPSKPGNAGTNVP